MGGKCGNRTEDKATESHEGADAGRTGRQTQGGGISGDTGYRLKRYQGAEALQAAKRKRTVEVCGVPAG